MEFLVIKLVIFACVGLALWIASFQLLCVVPLDKPSLGRRGLKRAQAIEEGGSFAQVEPLIRYFGSLMTKITKLRYDQTELQARIVRAGDYLGLNAPEFHGMQLMGAVVGLLLALFIGASIDVAWWVYPLLVAIGWYLPVMQLNERVEGRLVEINRTLPGAIDLASLCMSAGMDLVNALKQVTAHQPTKKQAIYEELELILQQLELGHTRKQALLEFSKRNPSVAVRDFVNAVVQAEEKGNPLAQVLEIQAQVLRMRRSMLAEEAAAKAGVKMMLPLTMLFATIMLIVLGPFFIKNMQNGF